MPDPKKKKYSTTPDKKNSAMVQVPAGKGASRYASKDSAAGKRITKAKKALELKKKGKRLLQSEKNAIRKSFNPTKVRKAAPKTKAYKKK